MQLEENFKIALVGKIFFFKIYISTKAYKFYSTCVSFEIADTNHGAEKDREINRVRMRERERKLGEQEEREKQIEKQIEKNREIEKERNRGKLRDSLYKITQMSLTGANSSFNTLVDHNFQHEGFVGYFILYSSHSTNLISHIRYGPFNGWIDDSVH